MTNRFGTTEDMVIQTVEEGGRTYALAIDDSGLYLTTREKLNTNLADPNRFASDRRAVAARLSALGLDPVKLFQDNQGKIQSTGTTTAKKINPLKASKRASKKAS